MSTSSKHTPGPWEINEGMSHDGIFNVWSENGEDVCTVWGIHDNGRANARLIAAAPEMYEALVALRECMRQINGDDPCESEQMAEAALAKADGKEMPLRKEDS